MTVYHSIYSQNKTTVSTNIDNFPQKDSIPRRDTAVVVDSFTLPIANDDIKSKIEYQAQDSIVYDMTTKKMHLYNQSKVNYTDMKIEAYYIDYNWTTSTLDARQNKISKDSILGKPYLRQAEKDYYTEKMAYNFKTRKGKVYNIVTKEDEALIHGKEVKKDSIGNWFIGKAKYTTCNLEDPHFYFSAKKLKLTTKKSIVSGPTNLVLSEVKTPFYLPFGIFPAQNGRRSGIILPREYGFNPEFNLREMGVYFGINDHIDATLLADVYFNGSYFFNGKVRYNTLYKYDGSFNLIFQRTYASGQDPDNPAVAANTKPQYSFTWVHNQSSKAHPTFRFNSQLSYMTSQVYSQSYLIDARRINGQITSNLNVTKRFRNSPFVINGGIGYTQDLASQTISGNLPTLRVNYNGNPFKIKSNPNHFVNNINLAYATEAVANLPKNPDSILFTSRLFDSLNYGMNHTFSFNFGGLKLFKYFNIVPGINYQDRFYFRKETLNYVNNKVVSTKENGFYSVRDFNAAINLNTVLSGYYLFGKNAAFRGFKHTMIPSVSFSFAPDFTKDFWGYYQTYNRHDTVVRYFPYRGTVSAPGSSQSAMLSFGINNAFEGKFRNKKDSVNGYMKKSLLDVFSIGGSYNLIADSFQLSPLTASFSNSTLGFITIGGGMSFDPYSYDSIVRKDKYRWNTGQGLLKMTNLNASISLNLNSQLFNKNRINHAEGTQAQKDYLWRNFQHFYDFNSPWNAMFSINVNLSNTFSSLTRRDTSLFSMNIFLNNFDFNVTKNWKIAISSGYDWNAGRLGMTTIKAIRNMHCWEFAVTYVPISNLGGQAYLIEIRPKAKLLQDLKLSRNRPIVDSYF